MFEFEEISEGEEERIIDKTAKLIQKNRNTSHFAA
jgi:hypothetical protein